MRLQKINLLQALLSDRPAVWSLTRALELETLRGVELSAPVLDLGCGDGYLAQKVFEGQIDFGVDLNPTEIARAKKTGAYKNLTVGNIEALPFEDNFFQSIFSISVLEHVRDLTKALREIYRVLKPGGSLILNVPNEKLLSWLFLRPILGEEYATQRIIENLAIHHLLPTAQWQSFLKEAGFQVERVQECVSREAVTLFDLESFWRTAGESSASGKIKNALKSLPLIPSCWRGLKKIFFWHKNDNPFLKFYAPLFAKDAELCQKNGGAIVTFFAKKA